jgi:hypothetical protein
MREAISIVGTRFTRVWTAELSARPAVGLQNDGGGALIFGEGAARVVGGVHAESVYAKFAEFGANAGAQRPVGGDHENCVHRSRIKHERRKRSAFRHYFSSTARVALTLGKPDPLAD